MEILYWPVDGSVVLHMNRASPKQCLTATIYLKQNGFIILFERYILIIKQMLWPSTSSFVVACITSSWACWLSPRWSPWARSSHLHASMLFCVTVQLLGCECLGLQNTQILCGYRAFKVQSWKSHVIYKDTIHVCRHEHTCTCTLAHSDTHMCTYTKCTSIWPSLIGKLTC